MEVKGHELLCEALVRKSGDELCYYFLLSAGGACRSALELICKGQQFFIGILPNLVKLHLFAHK